MRRPGTPVTPAGAQASRPTRRDPRIHHPPGRRKFGTGPTTAGLPHRCEGDEPMPASANGRTDSTASTTREVRNVVVVGPQGAGKTMLIESLLLANKNITRLGSKTEGTSVADHTEAEKRLQRSINLAVVTTEVSKRLRGGGAPVTLTLLATPGHPDYVGEVR